jgi:hypothetical protein
MPKTVVISQPMFLPWVGLFEQARLADVWFHYDDVQLPQGRYFTTRVQIKTADGVAWLTAPLDRKRSGKMINEAVFTADDWRGKHLRTIQHAYGKAPHFDLMFGLVEKIYGLKTENLAEFNMHGFETIARSLGLTCEFRRSSTSEIAGASSQRLVDLCAAVGADAYVTGHGALNYLEYEKFEARGIEVRYIDYQLAKYPQRHGEFTPYVSILDPIANVGEAARDILVSPALPWREFVAKRDAVKPTAE